MNLRIIIFLFFLIAAMERIISMFCYKERDGKVKYRWTTYILIFSYIFCVSIAFFEFVTKKENLNILLTSSGLFILYLGFILRKLSIKSLGGFWSKHIKNIAGQDLIKSGPYRWVRHPYYLAVIFELIGWILLFNSILAFWFFVSIHLPLLLYRISLEEKVLLEHFGKDYQKYKSHTGILLPKIPLGNFQ